MDKVIATYLSSETLITPSSPGINTAALISSLQPSNFDNKAGFFVVEKRLFAGRDAGFISAAISNYFVNANKVHRVINRDN